MLSAGTVHSFRSCCKPAVTWAVLSIVIVLLVVSVLLETPGSGMARARLNCASAELRSSGPRVPNLGWARRSTFDLASSLLPLLMLILLASTVLAVASAMASPRRMTLFRPSAAVRNRLGTPVGLSPDHSWMLPPSIWTPSSDIDCVGLLMAIPLAIPPPITPDKAELELLIVALPLVLSRTSPLSLMSRLPFMA